MNKTFFLAAFERAAKSAAQTLVVLWGADGGLDLFHVSIQESLSLAAGAAVLSVLTSIGSAGVGNSGPSLATESLAPAAPVPVA